MKIQTKVALKEKNRDLQISKKLVKLISSENQLYDTNNAEVINLTNFSIPEEVFKLIRSGRHLEIGGKHAKNVFWN